MRETVLAMLEQHVLLGQRHIARQREIVADFHHKGFRADLAEDLLTLFEQMQLLHVAHRDRILTSSTQTPT
ncbi:hypothetical protein EN742_28990 [Mesorhizobium sp. M4A.F.Ca.ET.020.02.1.1]|nr:hypothetical protein EN742_28990 [Mesorhizobium sp. M4A.F.Ca.ET.020.02.1.1]RWC14101.1 MAG: hypothetical protein EOS53_23045 [Mesorhizobium sp.]RWD33168.1 MAG: hypothetical protein EOS33_12100 [Mesorhizobium sp.]TIX67258.1 MAG: hypothetical protein E5V33_02860 [Mesorhizobium sp.]